MVEVGVNLVLRDDRVLRGRRSLHLLVNYGGDVQLAMWELVRELLNLEM